MASVGFVAYHRGLPVNDFRYLARGRPSISIGRIPGTRSSAPQLAPPVRRAAERLPLRRAVRGSGRDHRSAARRQQWIDLGLEGAETIPVDVQPAVKQAIAEFFAEHFDLTDRRRARSSRISTGCTSCSRTLATSTVIDPPVELDAYLGDPGGDLRRADRGPAAGGRSTWNLFSDRIQTVPAAATDEAGPAALLPQAGRQRPVVEELPQEPDAADAGGRRAAAGLWPHAARGWLAWSRRACRLVVGALQTSAPQGRRPQGWATSPAAPAGGSLARRSGRRVDERCRRGDARRTCCTTSTAPSTSATRSTIYDVLDRSVTGDLLTQTYLETRRGLELQSQGGAARRSRRSSCSRSIRSASRRPGFWRGAAGTCRVASGTGATCTRGRTSTRPSSPSSRSMACGRSPG